MNKLICAAAISSSLVIGGNAVAHHSSAPHFDRSKEVDVTGKVTELKFVNPHAYIYFDVEENGETVNWRCELSSASQLARNGWAADMFPTGEQIRVVGSPARREDHHCFMNSLVREDGTEISRNGPISERTETIAEETPRAKYLENGQPNLEGPWISRSFGRNSLGRSARYESNAAGEAAAEGYDMAFDDPILRCHFVNILNGWNHDTNVNDIYQTDDTITIQYGFMDTVRTIHLNMDEHPADIEPSSTGHSIGHWDGDTLIVDTIGFSEGILAHRSGQKHSDQMHVVERFHVDPETTHLIRDYTVTDPLYLVGTATGQDVQALSPTPYQSYNCVELSGKNNIRPSELSELEEAEEVIEEPKATEPEDKPWWKLW